MHATKQSTKSSAHIWRLRSWFCENLKAYPLLVFQSGQIGREFLFDDDWVQSSGRGLSEVLDAKPFKGGFECGKCLDRKCI